MEEEDDDDLYAPYEEKVPEAALPPRNEVDASAKQDLENADEDEEEGEELEEEGSDSDIDIITERKGGPSTKIETTQPLSIKESRITAASAPTGAISTATHDSRLAKSEGPAKQASSGRPGSSYPATKSSTIDVDAKPVYEPTGKLITDMDMDTDFPEDDKPWRRPGTDMTDYFNYGFDEFTWATYCLKQQNLRKEVTNSKKEMEDMQSFFSNAMPSLPNMPGAPSGAAPPGMPSMGGTADIPPDMQQMFQQMMAQGLDPMTMGPEQMMAMMQGAGPMGDSNQNYGGQGFGQQGQGGHQMGYGNGFSGGAGSNQGGRGRGRRWQ